MGRQHLQHESNPASAAVNGVGSEVNLTPAATLVYYLGSTASGTPLAGAPVNAGTYTSSGLVRGQHELHGEVRRPRPSPFIRPTRRSFRRAGEQDVRRSSRDRERDRRRASVDLLEHDSAGLLRNPERQPRDRYHSRGRAVHGARIAEWEQQLQRGAARRSKLLDRRVDGDGFHQPVGIPNSFFAPAPNALASLLPAPSGTAVLELGQGQPDDPLKFNLFAAGVELTSTQTSMAFVARHTAEVVQRDNLRRTDRRL